MPRTPAQILQKYWGYTSFRPLQEEIISSVLQGRDTLALLPTGGGKSVCYQVPALLCEGLCLVVSPLISLMKDQVQQLRDRGIKAACLVAGTTETEQEIVFNHCIYGKLKLLYVSPERLRQRVFIEHFRRMKVSLIAVDEAHSISQWGYDFRPSYLEISALRQYHPAAPVIALTATATREVVVDIQARLLFRPGHQTFQSSFVRSNLAYMVFHEQDKWGRLLRIVRNVGGAGVIYVRNRRRTREVADYLVAQGITAGYYHAGLTARERDISQTRWMQGQVQVMVATNAFGMGIDKPDVRFVVHLDIPSSLEAYFQEAGRAGRDGIKSYAVMLYDDEDVRNARQLFEDSFPSREYIASVYKAVCNYYQVPIGSGCGMQYDFNLEDICHTYNFKPSVFYNAIRFLEREGLLSVPDREDAESQVYVPIDKEQLYRFQLDQPRYADLLTLLLRMYGGLFTEFVPVSERQMARRLMLDEATVMNMLRHVDALKVIHYKPRHDRPQIHFLALRIHENDLYLSDANYRMLKERAQQRLDAMLRYVGMQEGCRSRALVTYFGEETAHSCGCCDLCIGAPRADEAGLRERVVALLRERPMRPDQLVGQFDFVGEKVLLEWLQRWVDEGVLHYDQLFQLTV